MLGFLALTMFAVSSTSRSTTVKPAAGYADRAAIRRQAALWRSTALAAVAENSPAGDWLDYESLCVPDLIEQINASSAFNAANHEGEGLQTLLGPATTRLTPAHVETVPERDSALTTLDERTYDAVYDRVVLGIAETQISTPPRSDRDEVRELSATDITIVFQSVMRDKSIGSRNATRKTQRRASLNRPRLPVERILPLL
jgi:hypothetical protein